MTLPRVLLLLTGLALLGCYNNNDYEKSVPPTVAFSLIQVTDSSATLRVDIIKKGTAYYSRYEGIAVVWDTSLSNWETNNYQSLERGGVTQNAYEVTIDSLAPATTYYVNSYHSYNEWTIGGGSSVGDIGEENFSLTTLPD